MILPTRQLTVSGLALLLLTGVLLLASACTPSVDAAAGAAPVSAAADGRSITVIGVGEAAGQPDEARIVVGVDTFAKDVNAATTENEETIQAVLAALKEQGVASRDIQTSNYNLWAEQRYGDNGPEGIAGYRVGNQVNVTIRDIDKVGDVLTAVIDAGANTIYGVNFAVADPDLLEAEAREAAIANARERAQSLADLSGVTLGEVQSVDEMYTQMPGPMGLGGGAAENFAQSSISPGQLSYLVQVQVKFAME